VSTIRLWLLVFLQSFSECCAAGSGKTLITIFESSQKENQEVKSFINSQKQRFRSLLAIVVFFRSIHSIG
jgi:hypothetical protein